MTSTKSDSLVLEKHPTFSGRKGPVVILVADGVGIAPDSHSNAVSEARTPTLDKLMQQDLYTELLAHGKAVGLPSDDDMGNSEVGHNAIGAGRIFAQGAKLVNQALDSGDAFTTDTWSELIERGKSNTLHLMGLHSDGNIHSHIKHLHALMHQAAQQGVKNCSLHILLDGRDVAAKSALTYIEQTEAVIKKINQQYDAAFQIASGGGRMAITMDRYEADWEMVKRGYECHTHGVGERFTSAAQAINSLYESSNKDDQYLPAFVIEKNGQPVGLMNDGDAVLFFNFRGDRAIEISLAYERDEFEHFARDEIRPQPKLFYAGMLQYDGDELVPANYLVNPPEIDRTMGEYLCASGAKSFAVSETQKYGHVTYFWNGNRSGYLDKSLEKYIEIPSDNIEFNQAPAMKAEQITDTVIELIASGEFDFGRLNLANGDMVGHTGDLAAAITAMEVVDQCIARLIDAIAEAGGVLIVTADHGNADIMFTEKDGVRTPKTSHTLSKVPFAIVDPNFAGEYRLGGESNAGLANIAATSLNLMGFQAPGDYQPSLLKFDSPD